MEGPQSVAPDPRMGGPREVLSEVGLASGVTVQPEEALVGIGRLRSVGDRIPSEPESCEREMRSTVKRTALAIGALLVITATALSQAKTDWRETAVHMRLQDDLDRPQDGWCLDVVGSGRHIRFDMPLIAHNIKPGLYADEAVEFTDEGQIRFPAYPGYCVTVMGLNEFALPGAALMLKECGADIPFLNASKFQTFELLENGMVQLKGTDLVITVGDVSERTFDPTHRWRTLYMERRDKAELSRSAWKFVRP